MTKRELKAENMDAVVGGVMPKNSNPNTNEFSAPPEEEDTITKCINGAGRIWNAVKEMWDKCWPL